MLKPEIQAHIAALRPAKALDRSYKLSAINELDRYLEEESLFGNIFADSCPCDRCRKSCPCLTVDVGSAETSGSSRCSNAPAPTAQRGGEQIARPAPETSSDESEASIEDFLPPGAYENDDSHSSDSRASLAATLLSKYSQEQQDSNQASKRRRKDIGDGSKESVAEPGSSRGEASMPWTGLIAGSSCEDFSIAGNREGEAGPHMEEFMILKYVVLNTRPDWWVHEITDGCQEEFLKLHFCSEYCYITGIVSPLMFGWPVKRPRRYTFFYNKAKCDLGRASFTEFVQMFAERPALSGDIFLIDPHREDFEDQMARNHGNYRTADKPWDMEQLMTPTQYKRYKEAEKEVSAKGGSDGAFITDVEKIRSLSPRARTSQRCLRAGSL